MTVELLGTGREILPLTGRVIRIEFDERLHSEGLYTAAVHFEGIDRENELELTGLLMELDGTPPVLDALTDPDRRSRRTDYVRKVPAFRPEGLAVLVGRDLSEGGMRVERAVGVQLGDRLHLAVYGSPREEPLVLWATVVRDDGPRGLALSFDPLEPAQAARIRRILDQLPSVESLRASSAGRGAALVSRVLDA